MNAANPRTRLKAASALAVLALASTLLLAACGSDSSSSDTATASAASSPASSAAPAGDTTGPPRPTGVPDADWTNLLATFSDEGYRAVYMGKSPEELAIACQRPALTEEDAQATAEMAVSNYPESSVEEWRALYDYFLPQMQAVKDEMCADVLAAGSDDGDSAAAAASSSFDPPRPTGVPDSDWAAYLSTWNPADFETSMVGADPEIMTPYCAKDEATVREETIAGLPENTAQEFPESTVEEWTAFYDYAFAGLEEVRQRLCADY